MKRILAIVLLTVLVSSFSYPAFAQQWYKGNLHMHSIWSDGNVFPEQAIDWYKERGYHFVSLTDHSILQGYMESWQLVGKRRVPQKTFDAYLEQYGKDWVETKIENGETHVRLKSFYEFIKKSSVPGEFLIIPGHEQNIEVDGRELHNNVINVRDTIPYQGGKTFADKMRNNVNFLTQYEAERGLETLFILNHPCWIYFDIYPQDLIDVREVRFFEFLNCQPKFKPHEKFWSCEKFWDIVNAFRFEKGQLPLYGVSQDDAHDYFQPGPKTYDLGNYWIMVRADKLETEALIRSLYRGDFYCSSGVELESLEFDRSSKTLSVKVKPADGVKYTIRFNGTKKGFDQTVTTVEDPADGEKQARTVPVYSDEIGQVLQQTEGIEASYRMADDDLYVRVTVVSDKEASYIDWYGYMPPTESAWSQPYYVKPLPYYKLP